MIIKLEVEAEIEAREDTVAVLQRICKLITDGYTSGYDGTTRWDLETLPDDEYIGECA